MIKSKLFKKSLLLGLSASALVAIPLSVVACSSNVDNNLSKNSLLESKQAVAGVLKSWENEVLNYTYNSSDSSKFNSILAFQYTTTGSGTTETINLSNSNSEDKPSKELISFRTDLLNAYNAYLNYNIQTNSDFLTTLTSSWLKENINLPNQSNPLFSPTNLDFSQNSITYIANNFSIKQNNDSSNSSETDGLSSTQFSNFLVFLQVFNNVNLPMMNRLNQLVISYNYLTNQNFKSITSHLNYTKDIANSSSNSIISEINPFNKNFYLIKYLLNNDLAQEWNNKNSAFENNQTSFIKSAQEFNASVPTTLNPLEETQDFQIGMTNFGNVLLKGYEGIKSIASSLNLSSSTSQNNVNGNQLNGMINPNSNSSNTQSLYSFKKLQFNQDIKNSILNNQDFPSSFKINIKNVSTSEAITASDLTIETSLTNLNIKIIKISQPSSNSPILTLSIENSPNTYNFSPVSVEINIKAIPSKPTSGDWTFTIDTGAGSLFQTKINNLVSEIKYNPKDGNTYYNRILPLFDSGATIDPQANKDDLKEVSQNVSQAGFFNFGGTAFITSTQSSTNNPIYYGYSLNSYFVYSIILSSSISSSKDSSSISESLYTLFNDAIKFYTNNAKTDNSIIININKFQNNKTLEEDIKNLGLTGRE